MNFFDNNAISQSSKHDPLATASSPAVGPDGAADIYPMLIEHAAIIVGKTLRPEPGMFKFRSKLLKCTFDKGDIWAFVVRNEQKLIVCSVSCGPYKEFSIIDEIPFPNIDDFIHTQSKALRLPSEREVRSRHEAITLVAACMKRRPGMENAKPVEAARKILVENIRRIHEYAAACNIPEERLMRGLEVMFSDELTRCADDGSPSMLACFNAVPDTWLDRDKMLGDIRRNLLVDDAVSRVVSGQTHDNWPEKSVSDLLAAIVAGRYLV